MRISDWSSDVCSSDLHRPHRQSDGCAQGRTPGDAEPALQLRRVQHAVQAAVRVFALTRSRDWGFGIGDLEVRASIGSRAYHIPNPHSPTTALHHITPP